MEGKEGWVYVLTNEAMPGLVKVGYTMKDPAIRAEELYKDSKTGAVTGVPMPFVVVYKALVVNPYQVEQAVHKLLEKKRLNEEREFFSCESFEAIRNIRDSTSIKFEESKEDVDKRIQQQKELEEQRKIQQQKELEEKQRALAAQQEVERQRIAKEKSELEEVHQQEESFWRRLLMWFVVFFGLFILSFLLNRT